MDILFGQIDGMTWALMGAALAIVLAGTGSAIGVAIAGNASSGVLAEKPDLFGRTLVLQALPGTQGIYGFLMAVLMLVKLDWLAAGPAKVMTVQDGLLYFWAAMPIAVVGLLSAIYQGRVAATSIIMTGKRPELSTRGITMTALVETYAILALLVSILIWTQLP